MKLYHTIFYYATDFIAVMQENPVQISTFCPHNMPQAASKLYPAAAKKKYPGRFFQPNRFTAYKISRAMHMHGLSSHILYKANAHTMMSSQNLSVPIL